MITDINSQRPTDASARSHRRRLGVAGVSAMAVMAAMAVSLSGVASASTPTKTNCTFKTADGHYVTAVNSGGLTGLSQPPFDVIHTDAVRVGTWETFTLVDSGDGTHYGIQAFDGHYLTAVGGGGTDRRRHPLRRHAVAGVGEVHRHEGSIGSRRPGRVFDRHHRRALPHRRRRWRTDHRHHPFRCDGGQRLGEVPHPLRKLSARRDIKRQVVAATGLASIDPGLACGPGLDGDLVGALVPVARDASSAPGR